MKTLKPLQYHQVDEESKDIFLSLEKKIGLVPNLFAAMANSPQLLKGFFAFEKTLKEGLFTAKENEAIALAVSQINHCEYCLAAHTVLAKMQGFSNQEIIEIRRGMSVDRKLNALVALSMELTLNRGKVSQDFINDFLSVGYTNQAFTELIGHVALRSSTNYIFSNAEIAIDFDEASVIEALLVA